MYCSRLSFVCALVIQCVLAEYDDFYFSRNPKNVDVIEGQNVSLDCQVTPSAGIVYHWLLNGEKISNTTRRFWRRSSDDAGPLQITRTDRELDSGSFSCVAKNISTGFSLTSSEAQLDILWISEARVQLQSPDSASFIKAGEEVTLRCHVDGSDEIKIHWFRNTERVIESLHYVIKKKKLHIKNASSRHNGIYKCLAHNNAGFSSSVTNFALTIPGDQSALIQKVPENQLVKPGDVAKFDCIYINADVTEWYFEEIGPLENTERITILSNGSLVISDVVATDQGNYSCVGMRGESTEIPQTYTAELTVAYIRNLTYSSFEPVLADSQRGFVKEGGSFQQTCLPPAGNPLPKVWWKSPHNHTISDSGSVRVDEGRLIIENARQEDTGNYICVAENIVGSTEMSALIIVTRPAVIIEHPKSISVPEFDAAELSCKHNGSGHYYKDIAKVEWQKNGKTVNNEKSATGYRIYTDKNNGTLSISSVRGMDRGNYRCVVLVPEQSPIYSDPATLNVEEKLKFSPSPVSKKLELGSMSKIHCKAVGGTSPPIVRWIKHDKKRRNGKKNLGEMIKKYGNGTEAELPSHVEDINGTLHFNSVQTDDAGTYSCIARDDFESINATITVDVVVAPKFSITPMNPTEAIEGHSVMIHCKVDGDPKPTIQWDKNLRMNDFDRTRFKVFENGTLYISEVHLDDENSYGCTAGNSAGLYRKEAKLLVRTIEGYRPNGTEELESEGAMITKAVLITTSVAAAYIFLVVGLMVWCRYRRHARKQLQQNAEEGKNENGEINTNDQTDNKGSAGMNGGPSSTQTTLKQSPQTNGEPPKSDGAETAQSQSSGHSKKSKSSYDKFQISRQNLAEIVQIGRGEFGDIMIGKISVDVSEKRKSTAESADSKSVMIKSLTNVKDENALSEFKRQIDLFQKLNHENVAKLIGLCREAEPHYIVLEYTDWGDLKKFIIATNKKESPSKSKPHPPPLSVSQIVSVSLQLAQGMDHIANQRLVHKDLAARNCLITSTINAKVSLPALTKDVYREEYCKHINQVIPLRWLPHEAVYEDDYSTKSDVWSWACTVWELFNKCEIPFSDFSDSAVLAQLKDHSLHWKPHKATPQPLADLQEKCWSQSPKDRPTFADIIQAMTELMENL